VAFSATKNRVYEHYIPNDRDVTACCLLGNLCTIYAQKYGGIRLRDWN
jgi:hypothetical protein